MTAMEFSNNLVSMKENMERFALRLTYNKEEAKDLLQETYLRAFSNRDSFVEFTNLKAWAFTIMKNIFINNYRKSVREIAAFDCMEKLSFSGSCKESQLAQPDSELAYKQINDGINELSDEFKIPFRMHVEGYKYKEIAENLNLKIGTVKSRIFLTRKKLMERLNDYR